VTQHENRMFINITSCVFR